MKVVGRMLNEKEVLSVKFPFSKNVGKRWTLETMKSYIDKGIEEIEKDRTKKEPIEEGLKMLLLDELQRGGKTPPTCKHWLY